MQNIILTIIIFLDKVFKLNSSQDLIGVKGLAGPQGEAGSAGPQGPPGSKGEAGLPGKDGVPGSQGEKGEPGTPGLKGEQGDQGLPGKDGERGRDGLDGNPGSQGDHGIMGPMGLVGPQGKTGEQGIQGDQGEKGDQGEIGQIGAQGPAGPQGPQGQQGEPGTPGLKGEPGDQGLPGKNGENGHDGADGKDGNHGHQGDPGEKGDQGEIGQIGMQGSTGPQGLTGPQGEAAINQYATYRWAVWSTYNEVESWMCGNDAAVFGGVNPSSWSDGGAKASQISSDKELQSALFNKKGYSKKNSNVWCEEWMSYSSTNGKLAGALFRIKNTTERDITWVVDLCYSSNILYNEVASASVNGNNTWASNNNCGAGGRQRLSLLIPANRTSTIIFISASSKELVLFAQPNGAPIATRGLQLAFINNCLMLPTGLEFVDDLDIATGGYEQ